MIVDLVVGVAIEDDLHGPGREIESVEEAGGRLRGGAFEGERG